MTKPCLLHLLKLLQKIFSSPILTITPFLLPRIKSLQSSLTPFGFLPQMRSTANFTGSPFNTHLELTVAHGLHCSRPGPSHREDTTGLRQSSARAISPLPLAQWPELSIHVPCHVTFFPKSCRDFSLLSEGKCSHAPCKGPGICPTSSPLPHPDCVPHHPLPCCSSHSGCFLSDPQIHDATPRSLHFQQPGALV